MVKGEVAFGGTGYVREEELGAGAPLTMVEDKQDVLRTEHVSTAIVSPAAQLHVMYSRLHCDTYLI